MRKFVLQTTVLGSVAAALLAGCFGGQSAPLSQSNNRPAPLNTFSSQKQPPFGNTATNIQRVMQKPYNGTVRFVLMGDNRNSTPFTTGGNKVYAKVIDKVNQLNPDFAINLGDFTFDSLRPHWNDFEEITSKSRVPYLTVVGNHDILFGRSYYESNYTPPHPETGLDDYSFDYGNTRFIIMDSANYNFTERQFQWLEKQLQTPLKKVIFSHTPPRHGVWEHKLAPSPEVSQRWLGLNEKYAVDHVFLGHIHLYDQREINGVGYIVSGGAGAPLDKPKQYGQGVYHVVLVEIQGNQLRTQMVPIDTRIQTFGPTTYTHGLEARDMQNPGIQRQFQPDYIPQDEIANAPR